MRSGRETKEGFSCIRKFFSAFFPPMNRIYLFFSLLKFYWSIVNLQYCDNFCCTTIIHRHTFTLFRFFYHIDYPMILGRVPHAIQQVPIGQSFHIPQCAYTSPKPPDYPSPSPISFGNHKFVFKVCESISVLQISSFV